MNLDEIVYHLLIIAMGHWNYFLSYVYVLHIKLINYFFICNLVTSTMATLYKKITMCNHSIEIQLIFSQSIVISVNRMN